MANQEAVVTEDDLELAFKDDPKFGLELLHADFRAPIWRYIKSICRSLSPEDIADIYQNAMVELVRIVKEPDFDPTRPMRIVNKVVKEKTIDFCRRESFGSVGRQFRERQRVWRCHLSDGSHALTECVAQLFNRLTFANLSGNCGRLKRIPCQIPCQD